MKNIEFYFDFLSPYGYLAHCQLPTIAKSHGYDIVYKPFDLFAAKQAAGNTGPSTAQIPAKLKYAMADFERWSKRYGVPFAFSSSGPPQPLLPNKGTFYAQDKGQVAEYVTAMWNATFGSGGAIGSEDIMREVAAGLGWSADDFMTFVNSDEAARRYGEANAEAQERGVFGAPTMMVGDEMWWGNDRLDFLEEHLASAQG